MSVLDYIYEDYTSTVSKDEMAISLDSAHFLLSLVSFMHPTSILDLGSGFSSFVFRLYQKENPDVKIMTADTNAFWLGKTEEFLDKYDVSLDGLELWTDIKDSDEMYDLVFYDLGDMRVRHRHIDKAIGFTRHVIVVDDMHKTKYHNLVMASLKLHGFISTKPMKATMDRYNRFMVIGYDRKFALPLHNYSRDGK